MEKHDDKIFYASSQQNRLYNDLKIKELELQLKKQGLLLNYEIERAAINREHMKVMNASYVDRNDSFHAVGYLINKLENKNYQVCEVPITLFYNYYCNFFSGLVLPHQIDYKLVCLIENNKKEEALREIKERFRNNFSDYPVREWEKNFSGMVNYLTIPSDYYIQLAYFKDSDSKLICYQEGWDIDIGLERKDFLRSKICDSRYYYVIDYMSYIVRGNLKKTDSMVGLKKMRELADEFIATKNSDQKLLKKIKETNL